SWMSGDIGAICQRVQGSAVPDAYSHEVHDAQLIVDALWSTPEVHGSYSGDSLADLLVLDPTSGEIRYFRNNEPGNWGAETTIGSGWSGVNTSCLYFADMTGDGRADLLVLDPTSGEIRYFRNNGPGNWGAETTIGSGWSGVNPSCLYFADMTG